MSKKISSLAEPRFQLYFLCLVLFAGVTALLGDYWVALAELALVGVLYAVYCRQVRPQAEGGHPLPGKAGGQRGPGHSVGYSGLPSAGGGVPAGHGRGHLEPTSSF